MFVFFKHLFLLYFSLHVGLIDLLNYFLWNALGEWLLCQKADFKYGSMLYIDLKTHLALLSSHCSWPDCVHFLFVWIPICSKKLIRHVVFMILSLKTISNCPPWFIVVALTNMYIPLLTLVLSVLWFELWFSFLK